MRDGFVTALKKLLHSDKNVIILTGDLGFGIFDEIIVDYPEQFINVGISEQNMIGLAAGLALENKKVFVYSIGNFPTLRCLEQIRNDACYHDLNINIVSMGIGFSYGALGNSHHATEDLAIMRSLPNITIFSPISNFDAEYITTHAVKTPGVVYIRLDKSYLKKYKGNELCSFGNSLRIINGSKVTIFSIGGILEEVLSAVNLLSNKNINPTVIAFTKIKPIDEKIVIEEAKKGNFIVTVEEGNLCGGFGSAVLEVLEKNNASFKRVLRLGIKDKFISEVGSQEYLRDICGLSAKGIEFSISNFLQGIN